MGNFLSFLIILKTILSVLTEIKKEGGISYLVGGSVRDLVLGRDIKDLDIEVHKLSLEQLEKCLKKFGAVKLVGKKFGVLRLIKFDIDWSLPRKDTKGRKPKVEIDPEMSIEQACRRRDLTMNAMAIDMNLFAEKFDQIYEKASSDKNFKLQDYVPIIDPFSGLESLKNKVLSSVDNEKFLEDPLRFFRVMQFIGRFEMMPDDNLTNLCKNMSLKDLQTALPLAKERIFEEIKKLLLKSKSPSLGFRWLKDLSRLKEIFPELNALIGVAQREDYHPEGDVFEHAMQSLDAAATLNKYESDEEKFWIMLAALCHDLGKPQTTDEQLHCYDHSKAGVPIAKSFLKRFVLNKEIVDFVCKLVLYHVRAADLFVDKAGPKAYKRLAAKLAPQVTMRQLALLTLADICGRNPKGPEPLKPSSLHQKTYEMFLKKVKEAEVEKGAEKPVLLGRHLLDIMEPGPRLGKLLEKAYQIQIDEGIKDVEQLKERVLSEEND